MLTTHTDPHRDQREQLQSLLPSTPVNTVDASRDHTLFSLRSWQTYRLLPSSPLRRHFGRPFSRHCLLICIVVCPLVFASLSLAYVYRDHVSLITFSKDHETLHSSSIVNYTSPVGGTRVFGEHDFSAQAQDSTPPLSEPWDYAKHRILGVNLGGWLVIEPFVRPDLFQPYGPEENIVDEWSLCVRLGNKMATVIEDHYKTFITEEDFARIASAGLNWVRIPVGWWMIETLDDEPFLEGVSLTYLVKALTWAQRYGIRVNLDLHAVPGSQNSWNHSGRMSDVNFLRGVMGVVNAERALNYVKALTVFISNERWSKVVPMFSVLNEARVPIIGSEPMRHWYYQVYKILREGTNGTGVGPFMTIHDGFGGPKSGALGWLDFFPGADRLAIDSHVYLAFTEQRAGTVGEHGSIPCQRWAIRGNRTRALMGVAVAGEYSLAINDCGLYLNGVEAGSRFEGAFPTVTNPEPGSKVVGSCKTWINADTWSEIMKNGFRQLAAAHQDALRDSFFWTWKVASALNGKIEAPMWSYELGLRKGYIDPDARSSIGTCPRMNAKYAPLHPHWSGQYKNWQVGNFTSTMIESPTTTEQQQEHLYASWPPPEIRGGPKESLLEPSQVHRLVPTGQAKVLNPFQGYRDPQKGKAKSSSSSSGGGGVSQNTWWVKEKGCQYSDPWDSVGKPIPSRLCGQQAAKD